MKIRDVVEGYKVLPPIDKEKYQARDGLEGPFRLRNGKVVYYDPQEGKYYDPDTDMYIEYDDYRKMDEQSVAESKDWRGLPYQGPIKTRGLADALHNWFRMWETDKSVDTILSSPEAQPFKVPPKNIGALYRAIVPGDKDTNEIKSGGKLVAFATDIKGAQQFIKTIYPEDSDRYVIIKKTFRPQDFLLDFTAMFETYDEWALGPHYTGEYEVWMKSTPYYTSVKTSEIVYEYDPDKIQGVAEGDKRPDYVVKASDKPKKVKPSMGGSSKHPYQDKLVGATEAEVSNTDYEWTHGKKPKGTGSWFFVAHKGGVNFGKDVEGEDYIELHGMSYGDAKKAAIKWAKSKGHTSLFVGT